VQLPDKQAWTLVGGLTATGSGIAAKKALHKAWKGVTGNEPPANPEHPRTTWPEAIAYAMISGAFVGLARLVARKVAASTWQRRTGALPPGLEQVE
jgi:Protein of unknown function (DUF4235)